MKLSEQVEACVDLLEAVPWVDKEPIDINALGPAVAQLEATNAALTKRVAELELDAKVYMAMKDDWKDLRIQQQLAIQSLNKEVKGLQSQLAWTPVSKGLPTEPGVYEFLLNTECVTVNSIDVWRLDTELQSSIEWYCKDHDCFGSPLGVGDYRWFRRVELPKDGET